MVCGLANFGQLAKLRLAKVGNAQEALSQTRSEVSRVRALLAVAQNPSLQIGQRKVDPQEQDP